VEPIIGHQKSEGRLDRNFLRGEFGDKANDLLAWIGHNLRTVRRRLRMFFAWILALFRLGQLNPTIQLSLAGF
jgi:transposase, IS5 family